MVHLKVHAPEGVSDGAVEHDLVFCFASSENSSARMKLGHEDGCWLLVAGFCAGGEEQ